MSRLRWPIVVVLLTVGLTACSADHNLLSPHGSDAKRIAGVGWFMIISATAVTTFVFVSLIIAVSHGHRTNRRGDERMRVVNERTWVIAGGVALPAVFIVILSGMTLHTLRADPPADALPITVIGHQYWWEVRYPTLDIVTANEIHIPAQQDVNITLQSVDVIHSFWVPALAGKIDMIPGQTNHISLHANAPGNYRGQCAEFCGLQHANMIFAVIADSNSDFTRWTDDARRPAAVPAPGSTEEAGATAFTVLPCASCHTVKGTTAQGTLGPDLTHFASRSTIGAGTVPNTRGFLGGWIADAQSTKPGSLMPPIPMSPRDLNSLIAYLESLH